jgi:hypothetical protein
MSAFFNIASVLRFFSAVWPGGEQSHNLSHAPVQRAKQKI